MQGARQDRATPAWEGTVDRKRAPLSGQRKRALRPSDPATNDIPSRSALDLHRRARRTAPRTQATHNQARVRRRFVAPRGVGGAQQQISPAASAIARAMAPHSSANALRYTRVAWAMQAEAQALTRAISWRKELQHCPSHCARARPCLYILHCQCPTARAPHTCMSREKLRVEQSE